LLEDILDVVPKAHRWGGRHDLKLKDLLDEPDLLLSMPGMGLRAQLESVARSMGIGVSSNVEVRSEHALLAMVAAGGGVTLAPRMSIRGRSDVRAMDIEPPLRREI